MGSEKQLTVNSPVGKDYDIYADKGRLHIEKREETSSQGSDQSAKADAGKPRLSLVPMQIVWEIEKIRRYGNEKYKEGGVDNWKQVEAERHFEAFLRHVVKAWYGDHLQIDPESGYMHLAHAACDLAFFLELIAEEKEKCLHT